MPPPKKSKFLSVAYEANVDDEFLAYFSPRKNQNFFQFGGFIAGQALLRPFAK